MHKKKILFLIGVSLFNLLNAQDLIALLDSIEDNSKTTVYEKTTFKSIRLINGHTIETAPKNELVFTISHRFGKVNSGAYNFFGLDQSTIRLGIDYGISDIISIGIGRSTYDKLYDGYTKIKIARQTSGYKTFPLSITLMEGIAYKTVKWATNNDLYPVTARLYYIHELIVARKFNSRFSAQICPVIVHRNMVKYKKDENNVFAVGAGGRYKFTNRFAIIAEYYYLLPGKTADDYYNSLALGFEIETGGHVFQLDFSNSSGMTEKIFIPENTTNWLDGDILFGFNIFRYFGLKNK